VVEVGFLECMGFCVLDAMRVVGGSCACLTSSVQHLVLDEADKLFEMGFLEQIDSVMAACVHPGIVRSLFSATLPGDSGAAGVAPSWWTPAASSLGTGEGPKGGPVALDGLHKRLLQGQCQCLCSRHHPPALRSLLWLQGRCLALREAGAAVCGGGRRQAPGHAPAAETGSVLTARFCLHRPSPSLSAVACRLLADHTVPVSQGQLKPVRAKCPSQ